MSKKSFIFYDDYKQHFEVLESDAEVKELLFAIFDYHKNGTFDVVSPMVKMAMSFIKVNMDIDKKKYQNICKRNRDNGLRGGRPKEPKKPSGIFGNPEKPKKADTDTDTDTVNDIYNTYPTKCPVGGRSTGKNSKNKTKIESLLKKHDKDYLVRLINLYIKDCSNTNTYIKNFTTFLNNLPDIEQFNVIQQNKQIKTETIEEYKARIAG